MILKPESREEWLKARHKGIGGSDAGAVIGVNKYKTNVQLWEEKTGITIPEDISDKPAVSFGKLAEPHIRELFRLDYQKNTILTIMNSICTSMTIIHLFLQRSTES